MTREAQHDAHTHSLPNRTECYPNNSCVKTAPCEVTGNLSRNSYARASTYRAALQPARYNFVTALCISGFDTFPPFSSLPQTDGRTTASTRRESVRRPFAAPLGEVAAHCRETSNALCGVRASWGKAYARRPIFLNRCRSNLTHQKVRKSASFCRSNCFYENFGQKTGSRTTCASLARDSRQPSAARQASIRRTIPKSPRSCAANTASNSYSTSWATRGHPGSRLSAKPRTLARCVVNSLNSNAGSRRWKWASNKEAA